MVRTQHGRLPFDSGDLRALFKSQALPLDQPLSHIDREISQYKTLYGTQFPRKYMKRIKIKSCFLGATKKSFPGILVTNNAILQEVPIIVTVPEKDPVRTSVINLSVVPGLKSL